MTIRRPRYSQEEFARLGGSIFEDQIAPTLPTDAEGKIVAIDIETGEFEVGEETISVSNALLARLPDAQIWFVRVGQPAVHRIGKWGLIVYSLDTVPRGFAV